MNWRARGLRPWVWQRLSALYLLAFVAYLLIGLAALPLDAAAWRAWVAEPWRAAAWALFVLAVGVHAWVGVRDVVLDYVPWAGLRMALLSLAGFGLAGLVALVLHALFTVEVS